MGLVAVTVPVAAYAETVVTDIPAIRLTGLVISVDGSNAIKVSGKGTIRFSLDRHLHRKPSRKAQTRSLP